jgi:hypothetical protein
MVVRPIVRLLMHDMEFGMPQHEEREHICQCPGRIPATGRVGATDGSDRTHCRRAYVPLLKPLVITKSVASKRIVDSLACRRHSVEGHRPNERSNWKALEAS